VPEFRAKRQDRARSEPEQVADLQGLLDLFEENLDGTAALVESYLSSHQPGAQGVHSAAVVVGALFDHRKRRQESLEVQAQV
jgi:hypothetical protein